MRAVRAKPGVHAVGVAVDEMVGVSRGGRFELPPVRCAVLERRAVALLRKLRAEMGEARNEHELYMARLNSLRREFSHVSQFVDSRLDMLSVFTEKELRKWFSSGGFSSPDLRVTDGSQQQGQGHEAPLDEAEERLARGSAVAAELRARLSARCVARRVMPETEQESHPGQFSDSR